MKSKAQKAQASASPCGIRAGGAAGQAAVEVLAYASFFLLVFAVVSAVFLQMQSQELSRAETAYAQEIAYSLSDHVRTAFTAGGGFTEEITLPARLLGKQYSIRVSSSADLPPETPVKETGFIYVDWQGASGRQSFSAPASTSVFRAVDSPPFISTDGNFISVDAGICQKLNISNVVDQRDGKNVLLFEEGSGCP